MDLLSLISAIPSLMSDFSGGTSAPYQKQQEQIAARQNQYAAALGDTNNPLYQQMYGQYKQQNQNNMASMIAEAQGQNRMNSAMGRTPLFNNERGSENIFRSMMQQGQNSGVQADTQTRQALAQGMQGNAAAQGQYSTISPYTQSANAQQLSGFQGISNLLRGMTGGTQQPYQQSILFPQQKQQQYNPMSGATAYNQPRGSYGF